MKCEKEKKKIGYFDQPQNMMGIMVILWVFECRYK
jgi:hypothetical protein